MREHSRPTGVPAKRRRGEHRKASDLRLALIDSRSLVLAALSSLLQACVPGNGNTTGFRVLTFSSVSKFLACCPDPVRDADIVVLNIGPESLDDRRIQNDVSELRQHMQDLPLAVMSNQIEPLPGLDALRNGINGYIPTTLSPSVAIQAIQLIHAGGTFMPPDLLLCEAAEHLRDDAGGSHALPNGLTARQHNVLDLIRQGKSNKLIAAELDISESTVKVYVHQVMKRLGATNRTHACFLLSHSGEDDED